MSDENRLRAFVEQVARMTTYDPSIPSEIDDALFALNRLIQKARELTGGEE